ncbi:hypothetical protein IWQ60_008117 [Tieghemiomyces parasiticus]|uniref:Uncharacterized protein n=1 Tax=Tieghemiomyces parasiticus TaxID=78921 RepID=A0A9W8A069_9FUNG|nr:hypothetical protein IWQ60_008117 [Tieghemiomyces parasiticus]
MPFLSTPDLIATAVVLYQSLATADDFPLARRAAVAERQGAHRAAAALRAKSPKQAPIPALLQLGLGLFNILTL